MEVKQNMVYLDQMSKQGNIHWDLPGANFLYFFEPESKTTIIN